MSTTAAVRQRLVLLATGVAGEARGAWFEPVHAEGLVEAARAGGLHLVEVDAAELRAVDPDLAAGQMVAPGQTTPLPPVRQATFDRLISLPAMLAPPRQIAPAPAAAAAPSAPRVVHTPRGTLRVGSTVLASVEMSDGWWEAEVVAIEPGKVLRLRWREFPGLDLFSKPLAHVSVPPGGGMR